MKNTEEILQALMRELNLSRSQIAEDNGVSLQAISNWCSRESIPNKTKRYFYKKYGISITFLDQGIGPIFERDITNSEISSEKYIEHLESENAFLRELVKTLTDFNKLIKSSKD